MNHLVLEGKIAVISGSTQGIGWAAAQAIAELGATCILLARNEESLKIRISELSTNAGQKHNYIVADFSQISQVEEAVKIIIKNFGGAHILVNNTGGPPAGPIVTATTDQFYAAFNQHLICNHILSTSLLPFMKEQGYGRIINVISTSVKVPLKGLGVSNTIRAAVASWAKTLSNEVASFGITVNNVLPGATGTSRLKSIIENKSSKTGSTVDDVTQEMVHEIPAGRFGAPEEIGAVISFLSTPIAGYINGVSIPVDGGRTGTLS